MRRRVAILVLAALVAREAPVPAAAPAADLSLLQLSRQGQRRYAWGVAMLGGDVAGRLARDPDGAEAWFADAAADELGRLRAAAKGGRIDEAAEAAKWNASFEELKRRAKGAMQVETRGLNGTAVARAAVEGARLQELAQQRVGVTEERLAELEEEFGRKAWMLKKAVARQLEAASARSAGRGSQLQRTEGQGPYGTPDGIADWFFGSITRPTMEIKSAVQNEIDRAQLETRKLQKEAESAAGLIAGQGQFYSDEAGKAEGRLGKLVDQKIEGGRKELQGLKKGMEGKAAALKDAADEEAKHIVDKAISDLAGAGNSSTDGGQAAEAADVAAAPPAAPAAARPAAPPAAPPSQQLKTDSNKALASLAGGNSSQEANGGR